MIVMPSHCMATHHAYTIVSITLLTVLQSALCSFSSGLQDTDVVLTTQITIATDCVDLQCVLKPGMYISMQA